MTTLSLQTPVVGQPNSTEDPKIASDLTAISNWANGNIDTTNLSNSAGIVRYLSGTFAARPAAGAVIAGTVYYASDVTTFYFSNASTWGTLMVASAWTNLTLAGGVGVQSGTFTPSFRRVGDRIELRGGMANVSGITIGSASAWASGFPIPTQFVSFTATVGISAGGLLQGGSMPAPAQIPSGGSTMNVYQNISSTSYVSLDGLSYVTA